ncbi:hypothetical protein AgCh_012983 [Apium graveolens]
MELEVVDKTIVGDQVLDVKKEEGEEVFGGDGNSENATNAGEGIGSSGGKVELPKTDLENKLSNCGKVTGAISKNVRPTTRKKATAKHFAASLSKSKATVSNRTAKPVSRRASARVCTNGEGKGAASASIGLVSVPSVHQSKCLKSVVTNGSATCPPADGFW